MGEKKAMASLAEWMERDQQRRSMAAAIDPVPAAPALSARQATAVDNNETSDSLLRSLLLEMQQHKMDMARKSNMLLAILGVMVVFFFTYLERLQTQVRSLEMTLMRTKLA